MTAPQPATPPRPRVVTASFWCWVTAAALLVLYGMLTLSSTQAIPPAVRGFGVLWVLTGLAWGYFAGKAGQGSARFRRGGVALAFTVAVIMVLLFPDLLGVPIAILGVVGAVLMVRPSASAWFAVADHADDQR